MGKGFVGEEDTTSVRTDEFKIYCGVGARVCSNDLDMFLSLRLPNSASIFKAKVLVIEKVCGVLLNNNWRIQKTNIYTEGQAHLSII